MIEIKISGTPHQIPSSWNDVTFLKYCDIVRASDKPFIERLAVYTGLDLAVINKLNFSAVGVLAETVSFMDEPDAVTGFAYSYESKVNIGHESYGKLEASKQAIKKAEIPLLGAIPVVKEYTGQDISNEPITKSIGAAIFFLTRLESSWSGSPVSMNMSRMVMNWKQVQKDLQALALGELPLPTPAGQT